MGQLTFQNIIDTGLLRGGNDTLTTQAPIFLKGWLRKQAARWPWPQVVKRYSGLTLSASSVATIGAGSGGVTEVIKEVKKPIRLYSADYKKRSQIDIVAYDETHLGLDQTMAAGLAETGLPSTAKVMQVNGTMGRWTIEFFPLPDQSYLMSLLLHTIPTDPAVNAVPWYPEDETMVEAVAAFAVGWDSKSAGEAAMSIVADMVVTDRNAHGGVPGFNEDIELDPSVFK